MTSIANQCFTLVKDCPTPGTTFYSMAPLLASASLRKRVTAELKARTEGLAPTLLLALDSRGYFVGSWLADALGVPLVALHKLGSALKAAPRDTLIVQEFDLEYKKGEAIALQRGSIPAGARILLVDDVLATGGTMAAAALLVKRVQPDCTVVGNVVLLQLMGLTVMTDSAIPCISLFAVPPHMTGPMDVASASLSKATAPFCPHPDDKRAALMWHPSMESIARSLLKAMPNKLRESPVRWEEFPDTWPNVHFEHRSTLEGRDVIFLASFHDKALIVEQVSLMIAVPRQVIKSMRVFIPYFGPATMERVAVEGDLATAETLAKMCSACLPGTQGGPPILTFFDVHALCERFYFDDRATVVFESALSLIEKWIIANSATVIFPDEGAFKRLYLRFKGKSPMLVCSKVRGEGDARKIVIGQAYPDHAYGPGIDIYAQPAIIIDDLVQSGSTLAECAVAIRASHSFASINAFVTHAIFPNNSHLRFVTGAGKKTFDSFFVTNTNPTVTEKLAAVGAPFAVLDIAPLLVHILDRALPHAPFSASRLKKITLCSQSPLKTAAVTEALQATGLLGDVVVVTLKTTGTVNQPIGHDEILACAKQRVLAFEPNASDNNTWTVAIESGIVRAHDTATWQEVTCILVCKGLAFDSGQYMKFHCMWAFGPVLDTPLHLDILKTVLAAKGEITVGELLHKKDVNVSADAWYNRQELIKEGLIKFIKSNTESV